VQATEWDHRLAVRADGKNLIGHAGVALLRKVADRVGLTTALSAALPQGRGPGWRDRGMALVQLACAIALGATNVLKAEQLQHRWRGLFPQPVAQPFSCRTPPGPRPTPPPHHLRPQRQTSRLTAVVPGRFDPLRQLVALQLWGFTSAETMPGATQLLLLVQLDHSIVTDAAG
jgi:hypothetical protein